MRNVQVKSATPEEAIQTRFARCGFFERWSIFNEAKASNTSLNFFYVVLGKNIKNNETVFKTLLKNRCLTKDIFKLNVQCLKYHKCDAEIQNSRTISSHMVKKLRNNSIKHKKDYDDSIESLQKTYGYSNADKTNLKADIESSAKKISASFVLFNKRY